MARIKPKSVIIGFFALSVCGFIVSISFNASIEATTKVKTSRNRDFSNIKDSEFRDILRNSRNEQVRKGLIKQRASQVVDRELAMYYDPENQNRKVEEDFQDYHNYDNAVGIRETSSPKKLTESIIKAPKQRSFLHVIGDVVKATVAPPELTPRKSFQNTPEQVNQGKSWLFDTSSIHDCITGDVVGGIPPILDTLPFVNKMPQWGEDRALRQQSFRDVFKKRAWGHGWDPGNKGLNASGMGSTLDWAQEMTATLHAVVNQIRLATGKRKITMLDTACGDMAWMQRFLKTRDDILYTGLDIVPELIESHKKNYGQFTYWQFVHRDVLETGIGQYDLVVSRMMMQHLYNADVSRLLQKISNSGSKYVLMTSFSGYDENKELNAESTLENPGRFRTLNLELPPFQLTPPLCLQRDGPLDVYQGWDHFIGLWHLPLQTVTNCDKVHLLSWKRSRHKLYSCVRWTDLMR